MKAIGRRMFIKGGLAGLMAAAGVKIGLGGEPTWKPGHQPKPWHTPVGRPEDMPMDMPPGLMERDARRVTTIFVDDPRFELVSLTKESEMTDWPRRRPGNGSALGYPTGFERETVQFKMTEEMASEIGWPAHSMLPRSLLFAGKSKVSPLGILIGRHAAMTQIDWRTGGAFGRGGILVDAEMFHMDPPTLKVNFNVQANDSGEFEKSLNRKSGSIAKMIRNAIEGEGGKR